MQIDSNTAEAISQLAVSLGLPLGKEEDLILALTNVDLVRASDEEAAKIWRDAQLPEEAQSFIQDEDAITWVSDEVLPGVKDYVNGEIQTKTIPYGYPFSDELLKQVYPNIPDSSIEIIAAGWEVQRWNAIKYMALCEIWKLADTTKDEYQAKGDSYCKLGEKYLCGIIKSLGEVVSMIPDNTNTGKLGLVVVKLRKNKRCGGNEYSL
jgi:hypothetical protein